MAELELRAKPRTVLGKKVRALRYAGEVPANVYGRGTQSQALQVDLQSFRQLVRSAGRNVMISLHVEGEKKPRPVMVRGIQRKATTGDVLHVDFYQVSLTEKIRSEVSLVIVGQAPAAVDLGGTLLHGVERVQVEALPGDVPPHLEVDVSVLATFEDGVHVRDLVVDTSKMTILTDPDLVVAKVAPPRLAAEIEAEEAAAAEEAAEAEEGVEGVEGVEAPAEEGAEPAEEAGEGEKTE